MQIEMSPKEEILKFLEPPKNLPELFKELDKVFGKKNDSYNELVNIYINQPKDYDAVGFADRLRVFINRNLEEDINMPSNHTPDYYDDFCLLDFNLQTNNFLQIYNKREIAAFLLHGESDDEGTDMIWLYRKLLHWEALSKTNEEFIIDYDSGAVRSYDNLLQQFFDKFGIGDKKNPLRALRNELEEQLKNGHVVYIIENPEKLLNTPEERCKLFDIFFEYMKNNIENEKGQYSLVFLFVEKKQVDYHHQHATEKHFFCYCDENKENYIQKVNKCQDLKIVDLAPIGKITKTDFDTWMTFGNLKKGDRSLYERINKRIDDGETDLLQEGHSPFKAIKKICEKLKIDIQQKWIILHTQEST